MKSPGEVGRQLARQWGHTPTRAGRLLSGEAWPVEILLGRPAAALVAGGGWAEVRAHLDAWRQVSVGVVVWAPVTYRATGEAIEVPVRWVLRSPSEWVEATGDPAVQAEHHTLSQLVAEAHPRYRQFLVERRALVVRTPLAEAMLALRVADELEEGCAGGAPLRALPVAGIDTKFCERNRQLLVALLDVRFDGAVSTRGLEGFLGAAGADGHWLLVADLDGGLLPYRRLRVTDVELAERGMPGRRLLVVENERCLHLLGRTPHTVAVLGAGLNLVWLAAPALAGLTVAYWGDLDTWGLTMLARARTARPDLTPLLMDGPTFDANAGRAVVEPRPAEPPPVGLTPAEAGLFARLASLGRGRLEQEFLPAPQVAEAVNRWSAA